MDPSIARWPRSHKDAGIRLLRAAETNEARAVRRTLPMLLRALTVLTVVGTTLAGGTLTAAPVRADDATESRFFDGVARAAFERGHWAEALEAFLRAYRAAPSSSSLYNIGVCAQLAHREAMAFAYFDEFLASPDADQSLRADATARHTTLAARLALVRVESDPPGAELYVDRRDLGSFGHAPRTLGLSPGTHQLEFVLADHTSTTVAVTAVVGVPSEVHATLPPHRGRLTVDVTPATATVLAHRGDAETPTPPGQAVTLPVGTYSVSASAPGYRDASVEVRLVRDADDHRALVLEPLPARTGRLLVTTGEVRARVRVDGRAVAEAPARLEGIPVGTHQVAVSAEGYLEWTAAVSVVEGRTAFVAVTLIRAR